MAVPENSAQLVFRPLFESPLVRIHEYACSACRGGPAQEEESAGNNIVLMRQGAFCRHFGRQNVTSNINDVSFFSKGSTYRVSHPTDCGDQGTVFAITSPVLQEIIEDFDQSVEERPEHPFPFVRGPSLPSTIWKHHQLLSRMKSVSEPAGNLEIESAVLQIASTVLEAGFELRQTTRPKRKNDSSGSDRVEAAKTYLIKRLGERVSLAEVARSVNTSPYHFARLFAQHTGQALHRYFTLLKLGDSLQLLADGAQDITEVALKLGFSSHSHFTTVFRREFGLSPSQVRHITSASLRELSKNLKV